MLWVLPVAEEEPVAVVWLVEPPVSEVTPDAIAKVLLSRSRGRGIRDLRDHLVDRGARVNIGAGGRA